MPHIILKARVDFEIAFVVFESFACTEDIIYILDYY